MVPVKHRLVVEPLALVPFWRPEHAEYAERLFTPDAHIDLVKKDADGVLATILHRM